MRTFLNFFWFFFLLAISIIKTISRNISVIKYKTYYPYKENILNNEYNFNEKDFIDSLHLSKIYFELEVGEEKLNQTLSVIIQSNDDKLILQNTIFPNQTKNLCNYDEDKSTTYKYIFDNTTFPLNNLYTFGKERFKIYNDLKLETYTYVDIELGNKNSTTYDLCGTLGLNRGFYKSQKYNFLGQLFKTFNSSNYTFSLIPSKENFGEGLFLFGDFPHKYLSKYDESDLITVFPEKYQNWEIGMGEIIIEGYNLYIYPRDQVSIRFSPDIEYLEFAHIYIDYIEYHYFEKYFNDLTCRDLNYDNKYLVISCDATKFNEKDIESFPKITFINHRRNFKFEFEAKEFFHYQNGRYYFKMIRNFSEKSVFTFGRMFLRKYLIAFNPELKLVHIYKNKKKFSLDDFNVGFSKVWISIVVFDAIVFTLFGIAIGKKLRNERKKKPNELLDDGYEYNPDNKNTDIKNEEKSINDA